MYIRIDNEWIKIWLQMVWSWSITFAGEWNFGSNSRLTSLAELWWNYRCLQSYFCLRRASNININRHQRRIRGYFDSWVTLYVVYVHDMRCWLESRRGRACDIFQSSADVFQDDSRLTWIFAKKFHERVLDANHFHSYFHIRKRGAVKEWGDHGLLSNSFTRPWDNDTIRILMSEWLNHVF